MCIPKNLALGQSRAVSPELYRRNNEYIIKSKGALALKRRIHMAITVRVASLADSLAL